MKMRHNFFQAPNFIFDSDMTHQEKLILLYLLRCCDSNNICFPSYAKICEKCNVSRPNAIQSIKKLISKGYIEKVAIGHTTEYGENKANTYKIMF